MLRFRFTAALFVLLTASSVSHEASAAPVTHTEVAPPRPAIHAATPPAAVRVAAPSVGAKAPVAPALYGHSMPDLVRLRIEGAATHVAAPPQVAGARTLIEARGIARPEAAYDAVAKELAHVHPAVLEALRAKGYRVVVSEGTIGASLPEAQKSYGAFTTLNMPGEKVIHIAVGSGGELLHETTGSLSYVLYSVGSAVADSADSGGSSDPAFRAARVAELPRLAPHYRSIAEGGLQANEAAADRAAFAEGFAFHFTNEKAFDKASPIQRYFAEHFSATSSSTESASGPEVRAIGNGKHFTIVLPRPKDAPSVYEIARRKGLPTTHDNLRSIIEDISYDDAVAKASGWSSAHDHALSGAFRAFNFHDIESTRSSIAARAAHSGGKTSPDGWSDVHVHGNANGVLQEEKADGSRVTFTPAQFAEVLRKRGYDGGPVRLVACETGAPVRFGENTAQQLANALHAPVVAASEYSWAYPDGRVLTQAAKQQPDQTWQLGDKGRWRVYVPAPGEKN